MPVHDCTDCDGLGGQRVEEPEEPTTWWRCEGCQGSGRTTSCRECSDPMPLPEAEGNAYRCPDCIARAEYGDREAEVARIRRWG